MSTVDEVWEKLRNHEPIDMQMRELLEVADIEEVSQRKQKQKRLRLQKKIYLKFIQ